MNMGAFCPVLLHFTGIKWFRAKSQPSLNRAELCANPSHPTPGRSEEDLQIDVQCECAGTDKKNVLNCGDSDSYVPQRQFFVSSVHTTISPFLHVFPILTFNVL